MPEKKMGSSLSESSGKKWSEQGHTMAAAALGFGLGLVHSLKQHNAILNDLQ